MPAGPGGSKPDLALSYNSASMDGANGRRPQGRASWAGLGWTLETPVIALERTYAEDVTFYALSLGNRSYTLVRGAALVPNAFWGDPTQWEWHTSDESYLRIRASGPGSFMP